MVWISILSTFFLLFLIYYLLKKNRWDQAAIGGLILKIAAGFGIGWIYLYHYKGGDTFQYFNEAKTISTYLLAHPTNFISIYLNPLEINDLAGQLVYYDQPRALFFSRIVSIFYLLSGGNYWIISAYLSFINFLGIHLLVKELNLNFKGNDLAIVCSFYFLPTFVFWTSGLLKESLGIASLAFAVSIVLRMIRKQKYTQFFSWIFLVFSLLLLWELKYYYAAIAIPVLASLLIFELINKQKSISPVFLPLIFLAGVFSVSSLHYNLNVSRVLNVIYENYELGIKDATDSAVHFYHFDGSVYGFLVNLPLALVSGLYRPLVFEATNFLQFIVSIENLLVFVVMILGLYTSRLKVSIRNPYVMSTMIYVGLLATFLAFATPNFGTLSRYKVGYWPFFVLLVLILYLKNHKKRSGSL